MPAYRRPLRGRFGAGIRAGVEEALAQFADLIADPTLDRSGAERGLSRPRARRVPRAALARRALAAYRLGARVAWRRVSGLAIEAEVDRRTLALLAEAVFAYIDELSALSAEGYAEEQSQRPESLRAAAAASHGCCSILIPIRAAVRERPPRPAGTAPPSPSSPGARAGAGCAHGCRRAP